MNTELIINPKYEYLRSEIENLPNIFPTTGEVIYKSRNEIRNMTLGGVAVNVKQYHKPHFVQRLIYALFRKPKGQRAYEYAEILLEKGIETPEPIALLTIKNGLLIAESYLVTTLCPYPHKMYDAIHLEEGGGERLAKDFALFTANMHSQDILHLDYSPGNILYDGDEERGYVFSVVDINRMRFGEVGESNAAMSFRRMWGRFSFIDTIAREYAIKRGYIPEKFIVSVRMCRDKFWKNYGKKHLVSIEVFGR